MAQIELFVNLMEQGFSRYSVSTKGRVCNDETKMMLSSDKPNQSGYCKVGLVSDDGKHKVVSVHILVAKVFTPNPEGKPTVNHKDHNRSNNQVSNLEWSTYQEQALHRRKHENHWGQPINQLTHDGQLVRRWDRIIEAATTLNIPVGRISRACRSGKIADNFRWAYTEPEQIPGEEWRLIPYPECEPRYVSSFGRFKFPNGRISYGTDSAGYKFVSIRRIDIPMKKVKFLKMHRLIAAAFYGRKDELDVNHRDGNPSNNILSNLEYTTRSENIAHAYRTGLHTKTTPVLQFDSNRQFVQRFLSVSSAARASGLTDKILYRACKHQTFKGGFYWQYEQTA